MFITDHTAGDRTLRATAARLGSSLPSTPDAGQQQQLDQASARTGPAFDALFLRSQTKRAPAGPGCNQDRGRLRSRQHRASPDQLLGVGLHLAAARASPWHRTSASESPAAAEQADRSDPATTPPPGPAPAAAATEARAPGLPAQLALPRQHLRAPVVPIGTTTTRGLDLPPHPGTLGWWAGGAVPGQADGDAVFAGRIDAVGYGPGAFSALLRVGVDDPIEITDTNGRTVRYRVAGRTAYPKAALPATIFRTDGPATLTLVSCGGPFDPRTHHYRDTLVVTATPTPG